MTLQLDPLYRMSCQMSQTSKEYFISLSTCMVNMKTNELQQSPFYFRVTLLFSNSHARTSSSTSFLNNQSSPCKQSQNIYVTVSERSVQPQPGFKQTIQTRIQTSDSLCQPFGNMTLTIHQSFQALGVLLKESQI